MLELKVCAKSLKSCLTLCDPMNCSPPGSSVYEILQERIPEWVAMPFSRGSSWPRDQTHVSYVSCTGRQVLYHQHHSQIPDVRARKISRMQMTTLPETAVVKSKKNWYAHMQQLPNIFLMIHWGFLRQDRRAARPASWVSGLCNHTGSNTCELTRSNNLLSPSWNIF